MRISNSLGFVCIVVFGIAVLSVFRFNSAVATNAESQIRSTDPPQENPVAPFMRAKLTASQKVLEGLVTESAEKVKKGAEEMFVMSNAAEWKVIQGPVYSQYSAEFRRTTEQLIDSAKKGNIDAAALSYMQLTMNCIGCHKYVKETSVVQIDLDTDTFSLNLEK